MIFRYFETVFWNNGRHLFTGLLGKFSSCSLFPSWSAVLMIKTTKFLRIILSRNRDDFPLSVLQFKYSLEHNKFSSIPKSSKIEQQKNNILKSKDVAPTECFSKDDEKIHEPMGRGVFMTPLRDHGLISLWCVFAFRSSRWNWYRWLF